MLIKICDRLKHVREMFGFFKGSCRILPLFAALEGIFPIGAVVCSKMLLQELIEDQDFYVLICWVFAIVSLQFLSKMALHYRTIWVKSRLSETKSESMKNIALVYGAADLAEAESGDMIKGKENAVNAIDFNDSIKNMIDSSCAFISGIVMLAGSVGVIADLNAALIIVVVISFVPQFLINEKKKKIDFNNMKKWVELNRKTNCYSSLLTEIKTMKEIQLYDAEELIHDKIEETDRRRTK